ncbi:MAG: YdcF family protein [Maritimibacter sp.]
MTAQVVGIILGAAVREGGVPSGALKRRIDHGAKLYHEGRVNVLIASGGLGHFGPSEAEVMRRILVENGVPNEVISLEDTSRTTLENLTNSLPLVAEGARVLVISETYHLPRAVLFARRLGMPAGGSGPGLRGSRPMRLVLACLREVPALVLYALRPLPAKR